MDRTDIEERKHRISALGVELLEGQHNDLRSPYSMKEYLLDNKLYFTLWIITIIGSLGFFISLACQFRGIQYGTLSIGQPFVSDTWVTLLIACYSGTTLLQYHSLSIYNFYYGWTGVMSYCTFFWSYFYYGLAVLWSFLLLLGFFVIRKPSAACWVLFILFPLSILNFIVHREFLQKRAGPKQVIASNSQVPTSSVVNVMVRQSANNEKDLEENNRNKAANATPTSTVSVSGPFSLLCKFLVFSFLAFFTFLKLVVWFIIFLLMLGAFIQANLERKILPPQGNYVTILYPNGYEQQILTNCVGSRNISVPTIWVEVGGGRPLNERSMGPS